MKRLVVDASIVVKWFIPEPGSIEAIKLLNPNIQLYAPDIIRPEVANTLWKIHKRQMLTVDEASKIIENFLSSSIEICSSEALIADAFEIAVATGRTIYDSLYIALAIKRDSVLISADQRLVNALKNTGISRFVRILH